MFRTIASVIAFAASASVAASVAAEPFTPVAPVAPGPALPTPRLTPVACAVDPAIASITLTKGSRPGQVRVSYQIVNRGRSAWRSGDGQQLVNMRAVNNNTGGAFTSSAALASRAAAGAVMQRFLSPFIDNAFDAFEFGGEVEVAIAYDPDILIDGNRCNDDINPANNSARVSTDQVVDFLGGGATSRTFRF
ncbi:MAG: hypothetical protein ACOY4K_04610 [Pseudomonadota bacterium]